MPKARYLLFCIFLSLALPATTVHSKRPKKPKPVITIAQMMTKAEFRAAGLHKLTHKERAALDRWLERYTLRVMTVAKGRSSTGGYEIEKVFSDGDKFIINGEVFEAQTFCFDYEKGDQVKFLEGSPIGACASAKLLNLRNQRDLRGLVRVSVFTFTSSTWCDLEWSTWKPLDASVAEYRDHVPTGGGFYRIRAHEFPILVYVGQTGRDLRERTRALSRNVYRRADDPPWNDPHTAAPGLWAWRIEEGLAYEVSVADAELAFTDRQCMEDLLLLEHRLEAEESTLCNHGRFHRRWTRPTNKKAGQGMERLPEGDKNPASGDSLDPVELRGDPGDEDWLGLSWVDTGHLDGSRTGVPKNEGVYRLN